MADRTVTRRPRAGEASLRQRQTKAGGQNWRLLALGGIILAALAVAGAFFFLRGGGASQGGALSIL